TITFWRLISSRNRRCRTLDKRRNLLFLTDAKPATRRVNPNSKHQHHCDNPGFQINWSLLRIDFSHPQGPRPRQIEHLILLYPLRQAETIDRSDPEDAVGKSPFVRSLSKLQCTPGYTLRQRHHFSRSSEESAFPHIKAWLISPEMSG